MTVTLTILRPASHRGPFTLRFNGPKATVTETTAEFCGPGGPGGALQAIGATNGRRLVPVDPIWWLAFLPMPDTDSPVPEQIEVEFSTSIAGA